ncbi:MAG: HD domain-containing phosphohydrolase [Mariprofundus sp.]|nr:HD domain-containing phosphohydrolase [Mariprofundus sp.]
MEKIMKDNEALGVQYTSLLSRIEKLNAIGIALSTGKDIPSLLEMILIGAKELTQADGGTLYTVHDEAQLTFEIIKTTSLAIHMGGTTGVAVNFKPIPLHLTDGSPNDHQLAAYTALYGKTVNIPDVYQENNFDFSGPKAFDKATGYHSHSFLTIPMKNHENDIIGVVQLINKIDSNSNEVVAFNKEDQQLAESLASQAAIALTTHELIDDLRELFNAFTKSIAFAIDEKSPYTGGHCNRVPILAMMMANRANSIQTGPLKEFTMSDDDLYAMEVAAWLHDCGKVTTPEYVVDKATKLETIFDRIALIECRFELLKRDAKIHQLEQLATCNESARSGIIETFEKELQQLESDWLFIRKCNTGGEFMSDEDKQRVDQIGARKLTNSDGKSVPFLTEEELKNLKIAKGTLLPEEFEVIKNHVVMSQKMLSALPFPKNMARVPEYAGNHHERMDGKGYPNGLMREEMSLPSRILAIADIFEALTACDRPYKGAKKLSESLKILGFMKKEGHIDPDLFDLFIHEKIYLDYAREYLTPELIDIEEPCEIFGYPFHTDPN